MKAPIPTIVAWVSRRGRRRVQFVGRLRALHIGRAHGGEVDLLADVVPVAPRALFVDGDLVGSSRVRNATLDGREAILVEVSAVEASDRLEVRREIDVTIDPRRHVERHVRASLGNLRVGERWHRARRSPPGSVHRRRRPSWTDWWSGGSVGTRTAFGARPRWRTGTDRRSARGGARRQAAPASSACRKPWSSTSRSPLAAIGTRKRDASKDGSLRREGVPPPAA